MTTSTISKVIHEIKLMNESGSFPANVQDTYLTATVPQGYQFLCWTGAHSTGWMGLVYPSIPQQQTSRFWMETTSTSARGFYGEYLVYR